MPVAESPGADIWYERAGSGPPVLFVTGSGGDLARRPTILDSPLTAHVDLVAYDHRGHGRSTGDGPATMADYARDAVAVMDAVGWVSCRVLGISFGGMVAQEVAVRWPERVERLVLACTSSGGAGGSSYPLHELEALDEEARLRASLAVSDTRVGHDWQAAHPEEAAELVALARATRGAYNPHQLEARRHHDTSDRLAAITAPTLVAAGRFDGIAPVANSEHLAATIPDAELQVFDGGHMFLLQDRTAFPALAGFLTA